MASSSIALIRKTFRPFESFELSSYCTDFANDVCSIILQLIIGAPSANLMMMSEFNFGAAPKMTFSIIVDGTKWTFLVFASFSNCENLFCFRSRMEDDRVSDSGVSSDDKQIYFATSKNYTITTLTSADLSHFRLTNKKSDKFLF